MSFRLNPFASAALLMSGAIAPAWAQQGAPSPPELELMLTPGRRCTVSATFLAGSLPTSSAVTTSTTASAFFLLPSDEA